MEKKFWYGMMEMERCIRDLTIAALNSAKNLLKATCNCPEVNKSKHALLLLFFIIMQVKCLKKVPSCFKFC